MKSLPIMPLVFAAIAAAGLINQSNAQSPVTFDEVFRDSAGSLKVSLTTDRKTNIYEVGESFQLQVKANKDVYVVLFNVGPNGVVRQIFPHDEHPSNIIKANVATSIPGPDLKIVAAKPVGVEQICCLATTAQLNLEDDTQKARYEELMKRLKKNHELSLEQLKVFVNQLKNENTGEWLAKSVNLITVDPTEVSEESAAETSGESAEETSQESATETPNESASDSAGELSSKEKPATLDHRSSKNVARRYFFGIGAGMHQDTLIPNSSASKRDVVELAKAFDRWGFDAETLVDKQATRSRVLQMLFRDIPQSTKPGDVVVLYVAGLGTRVASNSETDLSMECVALFDSKRRVPKSFLSKAEIAEALQLLYGRKIVVLADICFGAQAGTFVRGLPNAHKGILPHDGLQSVATSVNAQDIETVVFASNSEVASEERNGHGHFTGQLLRALEKATADQTLLGVVNELLGDVGSDKPAPTLSGKCLEVLTGIAKVAEPNPQSSGVSE